MNFLSEAVSLTWCVSVVLKSTLWLFVLLGLSFALRGIPAFRHRFLLGGLLGIGLLPLLNLFLPPVNLTLPTGLVNASELLPILNTEASQTLQSFTLMFSVWFVVTLFLLGYLGLGIHRARRLSQKTSLIDGSKLQLQLVELQKDLKLRRSVSLLVSRNISTPMTWGFWRPKILLPECALNWSKEQSRMVLLHELTHIKRADWLAQIFTSFICALYWFNPLVWVLAWQLRLEQEKACDSKVLALGIKPSEYASMLLNIAKLRLRNMSTLMARTPPLEIRLKEILAFQGIRTASKPWYTLGLITMGSLGILLASLNPTLPKALLAESPSTTQDKEVAALMWQIMSSQEPELTLASDHQDPSWQVIVSQDNDNTKVSLALPDIFSLKTWSDLIASPSVSVRIDSKDASNKIEINPEERRESRPKESDGHWL